MADETFKKEKSAVDCSSDTEILQKDSNSKSRASPSKYVEHDEEEPPPCRIQSSTIKAIDKTSVHRICSGQVVLTLATAVKELVENSIDAGAVNVEVKLKDYGSESVEVIDNGCGVEDKNFEGLTLKHHTSKLQDFDELTSVTTFGFRGEALSSLCALSNMTIITRHKDAQVGSRLEFDLSGKLTSKKSTPRQIGTTVTIQNIFHTLPVRHREFQRNLKKEFSRLVHVLNAYCIINTGVRISCTNQTSKGNRTTVVATNGNLKIRENVANVFSPKQLQSLLEFQQVKAQDEICGEYGIKPHQRSSVKVNIEGFVSKCEHGQGRSTSDRQFIFINKRPCDSTKIIKVINEVYHSYNRHQNPFIALSISLDQNSVDVNVTPDKRQIFMEGEKFLLAVIKSSLIHMYEPTTSIYKVNNTILQHNKLTPSVHSPSGFKKIGQIEDRSSSTPERRSADLGSSPLLNSLSKLKRSFSSAFDKGKSSTSSPAPSQKTTKTPYGLPSRSHTVPSYPASSTDETSIAHFFSPVSLKSSKLSSSSLSSQEIEKEHQAGLPSEALSKIETSSISESQQCLASQATQENVDDAATSLSLSDKEPESRNGLVGADENEEDSDDGIGMTNRTHMASDILEDPKDASALQTAPDSDMKDHGTQHNKSKSVFIHHEPNHMNAAEVEMSSEDVMGEGSTTGEKIQLTDSDFDVDGKDVTRKEMSVAFSLAALRDKMGGQKCKDLSTSSTSNCRSFRAKICQNDNQSAESELQREISKDMFGDMEVLGQFNLGFIITKLGNDLFIVDQHATDEKYNFEMLQKHTVLQSQKMIIPQNLELTASNETILVDNLDIFKKNGFDFCIDVDAAATQRVKLVSAPVSKNWSFGKEDIEELLFMLTDSPNVMCRPSRIRLMFASRACRKSIMVGTALNTSEMQRVVRHMGEIEQPWNCPHGRPTMRHLFNLEMLPS